MPYVIEVEVVEDMGQPPVRGWVGPWQKIAYSFVTELRDALHFATLRNAQVTCCYIADKHDPTIVELQERGPDNKPE